jgi:hypothetical protein
MRRLILVATIVLVLAVVYRTMGSPTTGSGSRAAPTLPGPAPTPGAWAPTFVHESYDGGTFELADKGVYVLTFWDALNRDSNEAKPYFSQLANDFKDSGVRFAAVYVGASYEEPESEPYDVILDSDGSLASMYNVKRVPRIFIITDGQVYVVQNNFLPENYDVLRDALEELVSPKAEAPNDIEDST